MPIVAMTREMGSRGREVAERVAEAMGLTLVVRELVEHDLAEGMHVAEGTIHRRLEGGAGLRERWLVPSRRLAQYTAEEILALALEGNVLIRGWGACVILREVSHVARVRVCAPMELREQAVMARRGFADRSAARRQLERNDAAHKHMLLAAFGVDRDDALLYDLVLNTGRLSIGTCVKLVCELLAAAAFRETEASRAALEDGRLEAQIRVRLAERFTAGMGLTGIAASVRCGKAVLGGTAIHTSLAQEAARLAGTVPGVKDVLNKIEVVRRPRGL
jgi:cytidylate kinase